MDCTLGILHIYKIIYSILYSESIFSSSAEYPRDSFDVNHSAAELLNTSIPHPFPGEGKQYFSPIGGKRRG